ncbi:SRPBCC family protein [Marinitenerispora sediminis]|uniref:Polyketide cyclase n=1 Tax=Marinitenerispora sediminis TaxID=1931232 RepID=A0A368TB89_9ACTN|nr:SRPBCC family protein [Marinitenerispora sediminis]RCV56975.1 polyketide cyclase [Marinitenerispora sediminis]RCV60181.1 polyketide cyclase [Marinitenerispora sediminis]RCV62114.1 polyketide cyclase [Marinitenerispora sediminis]
MTDGPEQIDFTDRTVGTRALAAGAARVLTIGRTYEAGLDDVWDACTAPDRLRRWFLPVTGDLRPGGRYQLEGNAGGTIERCDPPRGFAATWEYGGDVSWIEVRLAPLAGGRTRFELDHVAPENEHWRKYGPGAGGIGWDIGLLGLATHLAGREVPREEEWAATEEYVRFVALSSARWCEAAITAGADPAAARAAAERTTAFYTASSGT